jgi:hypothetical protein
VPILVDYDPHGDRGRLEEYVRCHSTERGIRLDRHRVVVVARKPG